ncbi:MAG TPA: FkbM family methyltransferase, partial [Clostridiales bacterium]|nr:FkbM family methyltransferase [Clostridiales bacterium]
LMEEGSSGHGSIKRDGITYTGEESVIQKTLDSYVNENNLNVGLIKVDIEGAEQDFLDGAIETIIQYRPILIISIYHSLDDFFNIKPKLEALNLGYTFKIYRPILKRSIISETLLIAEIIDDNN